MENPGGPRFATPLPELSKRCENLDPDGCRCGTLLWMRNRFYGVSLLHSLCPLCSIRECDGDKTRIEEVLRIVLGDYKILEGQIGPTALKYLKSAVVTLQRENESGGEIMLSHLQMKLRTLSVKIAKAIAKSQPCDKPPLISEQIRQIHMAKQQFDGRYRSEKHLQSKSNLNGALQDIADQFSLIRPNIPGGPNEETAAALTSLDGFRKRLDPKPDEPATPDKEPPIFKDESPSIHPSTRVSTLIQELDRQTSAEHATNLLKTLCDMADSDNGYRALIGQHGGAISVIVTAVQRYNPAFRDGIFKEIRKEAAKGHICLARHGCALLGALANANDDNRRGIAEAGAIMPILNVMRVNVDDAGVLQEGCQALCALAENSPENTAAICEKGGVSVLLDAIKNHQGNVSVENPVSNAIFILALDKGAANELGASSKIGHVIRSILGVMRRDGSDEGTRLQGCEAILNLLDNRPDAATSAAMIQSGCLETLVGVATNNPAQSAKLFMAVLKLVETLAAEDVSQPEDATRVVRALTAVIQHDVSPEAIEQALRALRTLSRISDTFLSAASRENELTNAVDTVMADYPSHSGIQKEALQLLSAFPDLTSMEMVVNNAKNEEKDFPNREGVDGVLSTMQQNPEDEKAQKQGCQKLQKLFEVDPDGTAIADAGCVTVVMNAMARHPCCIDLQVLCCWMLRRFSAVDDNQSTIIEADGINLLLTAMNGFPDNADVQENGNETLQNLSRNTESQQIAITLGAPKIILDGMKNHPENEAVQEIACANLQSILLDTENILAVATEDGIELVVAAMRRFLSKAKVQLHGCRMLKSFAATNETRELAAKFGGIHATIRAMSHHPEDSFLQEKACEAIQNMAFSNSNQVEIAKCGGIKVILEAMKKFETSEDHQEIGCRVLRSLSMNRDNQVLIVRAGGVQMVLKAMQKHIASAVIQEQGLKTLSGVTGNGHIQESFDASIAVKTVVEAMRSHPSHNVIQREGCVAICTLADCPEAHSFLRAGGIDVILDVLRNHVDNNDIHTQGQGIIMMMAMDPDNATALSTPERIDSVLNTVLVMMQQHGVISSTQEQGCRALKNIIDHSGENKALVVKAGGMIVLLNVMRTFPSHPGIQAESIAALQSFSNVRVSDNSWQQFIFENNGIDLVISAMNEHPETFVIQDQGCRFLSIMASSDDSYQTAIASANCIDTIMNALRRHKTEAPLQEAGLYLLYTLDSNKNTGTSFLGLASLEVAAQSLQQHRSHSGVQKLGTEVLWRAMKSCEKDAIVSKCREILELGLAAMTEQVDVQTLGCQILMELVALNKETQILVGREGSINLVLDAMRSHPNDMGLQQAGCCLLNSLAKECNENVDRLSQVGAMECVVNVMRQFMAEEVLVRDGCEILMRLVLSGNEDTARQDEFARLSGLRLVSEVMAQHGSSKGVQERGCIILWTLFNNPNHSAAVREVRVAQLVDDAIDNFPRSRIIVKVGSRLLDQFT